MPWLQIVLLPFSLGLLGFVEPCSIGSTLIVVKQLEDRTPSDKLAQIIVFAGARAILTGFLGSVAVLVGMAFIGIQRAAWISLGALYVAVGVLYLSGRAGPLMVAIGPRLKHLADLRGSAALGILFGLNIPACAAPLLFALLAAAAAGGATGGTIAGGFVSLALFGFALSLPLIVAVLFEPIRHALDWLAGLSRRLPFWTGLLLLALGAWSIWFGVFAQVKA